MAPRPTATGREANHAWLKDHIGFQGDDCLWWPFARSKSGYGLVYRDTECRTGAHRLMCEMAHGEPPEVGLVASHSCHNGRHGCVNPHHLRWATQKQNVQEAIACGHMTPIRHISRRGEKHGRARLNEQDVKRIRELAADRKRTQKSLAQEYGVHRTTITYVVSGKNWAHV